MTLGYRVIFVGLFTLGTVTAASAQQWGPSAQSKLYHDPGNPQTLTSYNTSSIAPRTQPAGTSPKNITPAVPKTSAIAHRRRNATTVHRSAYHSAGQ